MSLHTDNREYCNQHFVKVIYIKSAQVAHKQHPIDSAHM